MSDLIIYLMIGIAMVIGAKFGAQFANMLPLDVMRKGFGIFVILVGIKTFFGK